MLGHIQEEAAMPRGLYRDSGGWIQVSYDERFQMPMHRTDYEDHGYKPRFEMLPTKPKFEKKSPPKH